jgi:glyoxylate reductase
MAKPKILITRRIPQEALDLLTPHFEIDHHDKATAIERKDLLRRVRGKDGLLCLLTEKIDPELLKAGPGLKAVSTYSVGFDHVDVKACTARGIPVTNTPGVLTETTADFTWALLMSIARRVVEGDRMMRRNAYKGWDPLMLLGTDVYGKTLGIVGFGRIGQAVARRASGFGMTVLYHDVSRVAPEKEAELKAEFVDLPILLRGSDFITLHTVLDSTTFHLIDDKAFASMKRSAYLINAARGPIIDEKALVRALKSNRIRGAALDVYEWEPKMAPGLNKQWNAVLVPHLASASLETRTRMGTMAAEGIRDILALRRRPAYLVNPDVYSSVSSVS